MTLDDLILDLEMSIDVRRSRETVFEAVIAQITDEMRYPDGRSMNHTLERWPGGRWYRNLGDDNGHFWGTVQSIKAPELLEITGPMFMSYPVNNYLVFKLSEEDGVTHVSLRHRALGLLDPEHAKGVRMGWGEMLDSIKASFGES